jgi:hypothetical protein
MSLRLLSTPEPDPLPTGEFLAREERRPGELHDVVTLDEHEAAVVAGKAACAGVSVGLALTLLIELQLLADDLSHVALSLDDPPQVAAPNLRLSSAEANYLRGLRFARPLRTSAATKNAAVPVRVLTRTTRDTLVGAVDGDLERAIRWEVAALMAGRTIGELGLLLALRSNVPRR